ncbi:anti-sigma-F factor Fin family protein [Oceanobacillus alkalisoli]|uniref:anti-sigma-F factor Fin family protein n=1 Tax=Oceanobacillus alkalisoli TaxID=2925113 RepID=UPI001EF0F8C8|nr:anti-sigma-F factor Fin family protein [Oceanobacillus alkalisoli]MCF3944468.1 anti-sigma-F factor Fin family protein [Oceanobacillus alkalisoli]MCG5105118.1 anti-sigma-F factor Fin family protein [Oceanobacillus alkalisoli]
MAIIYQCRHCTQEIGRLEEQVLDAALLGIDRLTAKEKQEMMEYQANGDIKIYAICDTCEAALQEHPHYHELDYFIQ